MDGAEGAGYYYTPRHRMSAAADRGGSSSTSAHVRRTAGAGFWYGKSPLVPIHNGAEVIGHKTSLAFNLKNRSTGFVTKTGWLMNEYILHSPDRQVCIRDTLVLRRTSTVHHRVMHAATLTCIYIKEH